jgi:hypothetical protein
MKNSLVNIEYVIEDIKNKKFLDDYNCLTKSLIKAAKFENIEVAEKHIRDIGIVYLYKVTKVMFTTIIETVEE